MLLLKRMIQLDTPGSQSSLRVIYYRFVAAQILPIASLNSIYLRNAFVGGFCFRTTFLQ
jgi:hypothetical protein